MVTLNFFFWIENKSAVEEYNVKFDDWAMDLGLLIFVIVSCRMELNKNDEGSNVWLIVQFIGDI